MDTLITKDEVDKLSSREKLIIAARKCFLEQPYSDVSTRAIAELAGVNKALINYYFNSKQGLFEAMLMDIVSPASELIRHVKRNNPRSVADIMMAIAQVIDENHDFPKLMAQIVFNQDHPAQTNIIEQFLRPTLLDFRNILQQNFPPETPPQVIEHTLISMYSLIVGPALLQPLLAQIFDTPKNSHFIVEQTRFNVGKLSEMAQQTP